MSTYKSGRNRTKKHPARYGAAAVEFAVVTPLIVTLIFGSIEACNMVFLRQAVTSAAYEGAAVCINPRTEESQVNQRINDILDARSITGATITIDGPGTTFQEIRHGDRFSIEVGVPITDNIPAPHLFATGTIAVRLTAEKQ